MNTLTRVFEFDSAHRLMDEKIKCFNLHGHRFKVEVTFSYTEKTSLGYAVDFKDLKKVVGGWIDNNLDHACILNPWDTDIIGLCVKHGWKYYVMGLGDKKYKNPSAENIAGELMFHINRLITEEQRKELGLDLHSIKFYETPNCYVELKNEKSYGMQ